MSDAEFMMRALRLAARARGRTSPNPMVGALLVKRGRVIAEGYHPKAGMPHAEAIAIQRAGESARGATLYVSLEPCCHRDKRTPPCIGRILEAGIARVVAAMADPNPKVSGRGLTELREAGIHVVSGVLEEQARQLNESYIKHVTTGLPFVILKTAMTLDGKIATPGGESKWITGDAARRLVHRVRGSVDAIVTAIGTVLADDPSLTCRSGGGRSPLRVVIDPRLQTKPGAKILARPPDTILVARESSGSRRKKEMLRQQGIEVMEYAGERADLGALMKKLGQRGITSVMIEGGASLNAACLEAGIVDKVMFFIAPKIMGGRDSIPAVGGRSFRPLAEAHRLRGTRIRKIGDDFLIEGYIRKP